MKDKPDREVCIGPGWAGVFAVGLIALVGASFQIGTIWAKTDDSSKARKLEKYLETTCKDSVEILDEIREIHEASGYTGGVSAQNPQIPETVDDKTKQLLVYSRFLRCKITIRDVQNNFSCYPSVPQSPCMGIVERVYEKK